MAYRYFKTGVYALTNTVTGKSYIGSAKNLRARKSCHFSQLRWHRHKNKDLQADHDLYGIETFEFTVLAETTPEKLREIEQAYIDNLPAAKKYKIAQNAKGGIGPITDEIRKRMSQSRLGLKRTPEQCAKYSDRQRGEKHHSFCGYYVTPFGKYPSGKAATRDINLDVATVISWCKKNPDKMVSKTSYDLSAYLQSLGPSVIGKTYRDLGFYFIPKAEG